MCVLADDRWRFGGVRRKRAFGADRGHTNWQAPSRELQTSGTRREQRPRPCWRWLSLPLNRRFDARLVLPGGTHGLRYLPRVGARRLKQARAPRCRVRGGVPLLRERERIRERGNHWSPQVAPIARPSW